MNEEKCWPFIWGKNVPGEDQTVEIREHTRYLFPEFSAPIEAPNLQKLVDNKIEYSVDADDLGIKNVVMSGRQFIDTLVSKGTDLDAVGQWSLCKHDWPTSPVPGQAPVVIFNGNCKKCGMSHIRYMDGNAL